MKIFLIGFMGSGKSTLGKYAARENGLGFMDLDLLIEAREGMSISDVFAHKGEQVFREIEKEVLTEVCQAEGDYLISCGGGTPCFFDNMKQMNEAGITVYLDISSARLAERLRNSKTERPLLKPHKGDLQTQIHKMLLERTKFYGQAMHILPEKKANKKDFAAWVKQLLSRA